MVLADQPGELAKVGHAFEHTGVDVRDLQLRHAPHGGGGVLTVSVRPGEAEALKAALVDGGPRPRRVTQSASDAGSPYPPPGHAVGHFVVLAIASTVQYNATIVKQPLMDLGEFIRQQRERSAMSLRKLADTAGISNPYLSQIERGLRKPSAEILKSIARALSIRAEALYERAGWLEGTDVPTVIEAIGGDTELSHQQKQALTAIYRSFVTENESQEA